MRQSHVLRTAVSGSPKYSFPVLREAARREVGNTIHASRRSLDAPSLYQPGEHRVRKTCPPSLVRGHQAVILLGKRREFVKA